MATNINQVINQSLHQLTQVAMEQNEDETIIEGELPFANDALQSHTLKKVQYTTSRIPKIDELPAEYKTPFMTIMEPWEAFIGRATR
jgi:hypothetical protein